MYLVRVGARAVGHPPTRGGTKWDNSSARRQKSLFSSKGHHSGSQTHSPRHWERQNSKMRPENCPCDCMRGSVVSDSETPWTVACLSPLSMGFSGRNTGVHCCCLLEGTFPTNPGIKPTSPVSPALTSGFFTTTPPEKPLRLFFHYMAKGIHNGITLLINRPSNRVVLWMGLT